MNAMEILIQIRKIVRYINLESKKIEKRYGVSIPQVLCLNFLYNSKNYQSGQGNIKKFLNLNASTTSGIINRLENKGLVARLPQEKDRRKVTIALTPMGNDLVEKIPSLLHEKIDRKLTKLDNVTFQKIKRSLELLVNILEFEESKESTYNNISDFEKENEKMEKNYFCP